VERRRFLKAAGGLALTGAAGLSYTRWVEPGWYDVERVTLRIRVLPDNRAGTRLAQISDLHLSQYAGPEQLNEAVQTINSLRPDAVLLTGDYVGDDAGSAQGLIEPLRGLKAPAFAVFGNHDYWTDQDKVAGYLDEADVRVLCNQAVQFGEGLWLAGLDDVWSGRPNLRTTLQEVPADAATLLLAHEPDFFDTVIQSGAPVTVQLSGHSHGGQVRIPGLGAPVLPYLGKRYPIGLRRVGDRQIYTNRGLGVWPLPYRFNCRPEITLFTLEPV
jgi:predicted MPP superfamily phosphohydrolase